MHCEHEDGEYDELRRIRECEENPYDELIEEWIGHPPPSSIVPPHEHIVRLDIRGSRVLASYDRSHMTPSSDK